MLQTMHAADWNIAQEVRAVMGGNETDVSIDGCQSITSIRNGLFGYIGERIAPDTVVGQALKLMVEDGSAGRDGFVGFSATPTTYTVKFRVTNDFSGSPLTEGLSMVLAILSPAELAALQGAITLFWVENILWSLLAGFGLAAIGIGATWKQPYRNIVGISALLVGFLLCFVILMFATALI